MNDISITAVLPRYPAVAFGGQAVVVTIIQHADTGEFGLGARLYHYYGFMVTGDLNGKFISNIWRPRESLPISFCMTLGEGNSRFSFADSKEKAR